MEQREKELKRTKRAGYIDLVINSIIIAVFLFTLTASTCLNIYNGYQPSNMVLMGTMGLGTLWIVNKLIALESVIKMYIGLNLRLMYERDSYQTKVDKGDS